jgi:hypothetical protein
MIEDENHPAFVAAHQELMRRIGIALGPFGKRMDRSFIDKLFSVIKDHRAEYRLKGVDFPVLVVVMVPRLGVVHFCRADLDIASIRVQIVNFVQMNPGVTMPEVVAAFRAAFPDLKPDDVLSRRRSVSWTGPSRRLAR